MGDPGTSDTRLPQPTFGVPPRHEFQAQASNSALEPSVPSFSNGLHRQPPVIQPLHRPTKSFRQDGCEEWRSRDSQLGAGSPAGVEDQVPGLFCPSEDTRDVTARARVGEGEQDAVTMTARDLASLQPGKFLTDNTVDFYIRYLKEKLVSPENRNEFHFFNSFFFTKLLEKSSSTGIDEGKVDYEQLRMWTAGVNLFEKDYVFIPIIERKGRPCILHLDSIEGKHKQFEGQIRSYILQAWAERMSIESMCGNSENMVMLHSLFQMKYVHAKVPQQDNTYDCGLYVLHYIKVFLSKSRSHDLSFLSSEEGTNFTTQNFKREVFDKRNYIQGLIFELGGMVQVQDGNLFDTQPKHQSNVGLMQCQAPPKLVKETKSKKWKEIETSILLQCMVHGDHFCKGKKGAMHWDLIVEAINVKSNGGPFRSKEQCQNRFDSLLKAYKDLNAYCKKIGKKFSEVTNDEKWCLKLATPLEKKNEGWYNDLHTIHCWRSSLKSNGGKRQKLNPVGDTSLKNNGGKRRKLNPVGDIDANGLASSELNSSQHCLKPLDPIGSLDLGRMVQVQDGNLFDTQPKHQNNVELMHSPKHQCQAPPKLVKETKSKKWKEIETSILLQCMVDGSHFCNGKRGAMHWDLIVEAINLKSNGGPFRSKEQCQNRFDTLLKAYKDLNAYCGENGKKFCEVTDDEKRCLKLATPLKKKNEGWYNDLHTIYHQLYKYRKCRKLNLDGDIEKSNLISSPLKSPEECSTPFNKIETSESKKTSSREAAFVKTRDHQLPSPLELSQCMSEGFVPPLMKSGKDQESNLDDLQPSTSCGSDVWRGTAGNFPDVNLCLRNELSQPNVDLKDSTMSCADLEATPAGPSFPTSDDNGCDKQRWSDAKTDPRTHMPANSKPQTAPQTAPQTPPRSSRRSGASQYYGVRFRPDLQKWVAEIPVGEWWAVHRKVWLGIRTSSSSMCRCSPQAREVQKEAPAQPAL